MLEEMPLLVHLPKMCEDSFLLVRLSSGCKDGSFENLNLQPDTHFLLLISWNIHQKHLVNCSDSIALFAEGKPSFQYFGCIN